jgi:outer membrane protein
LLRGFGTNVVMAPIRVARAGVALSEWELRERVMDVVARTALVYNDLIFSIENLKVEERSLALANQLLRDNQKRAEIGVMSPLDITEARAAAAAREEGVILARRAVLDNENSLKQLITDEIFGLLKVRLDVAPVDMLQPPAITVEQAITLALEKRPDYRQAILELQQQRINFVVTRNNVLPQIDLTASYGLNGLNDDLASSIRNAFEENESEWRAGVVVRVPFPNRLRRGARDAEAYAIARALVDLKRLEQEIVVRVDNARGQIETARERIEATRQSRIFARERLSAEQEKLAAGSTTTFVVLELQKDLAAAEAAELRAITDFNKAVITYEREAGLTLDRNWIELD